MSNEFSRPITDLVELEALRQQLFEVMREWARVDRWSASTIHQTYTILNRQPLSTILPDLHHAKEQLAEARALGFVRDLDCDG